MKQTQMKPELTCGVVDSVFLNTNSTYKQMALKSPDVMNYYLKSVTTKLSCRKGIQRLLQQPPETQNGQQAISPRHLRSMSSALFGAGFFFRVREVFLPDKIT